MHDFSVAIGLALATEAPPITRLTGPERTRRAILGREVTFSRTDRRM
jgi:hypothetical protein